MYIYTYIDMCLCVWYFIPMVTLHAHKQICHAVLETFKCQDSHATNSSVLGQKKKKKVRMFVLNETDYIFHLSKDTHLCNVASSDIQRQRPPGDLLEKK